MSDATYYRTLSDGDFWALFEQGRAKTDPAFYEEFQTRTAQGRLYNPATDPQAWEKSTTDFIRFYG